MNMLERIKHEITGIIWGNHPRWGSSFDYTMISLIIVSIFALSLGSISTLDPDTALAVHILDVAIISIFTVEYLARIWTASDRWKYIFSLWGIIDLLAILPFWLSLATGLQALRTLRIIRIIRILKLMRYLSAMERIKRAIIIVRDELIIFGFLAVIIVFLTAVGIYEFEKDAQPEIFGSIPNALWFAIATLTTVGYGDVTPVTAGGKIFTSLILVIGLGVVAVPTGLISSGLAQAREQERKAHSVRKAALRNDHHPRRKSRPKN